MDVVFFATTAELRRWFTNHHASTHELWIGFYKKDSGRGGVTYREALDLALCYGWIDGVRRKVDDVSYTNRFTPRRARSNWSAVNIKRVQELKEMGMMRRPGVEAFERRDETAKPYANDRDHAKLPPAFVRMFREHAVAWKFFQAQPQYYRRIATWWVISAKREETRERRLARLIEDSADERRLSMLQPKAQKGGSPRRKHE
jgi:uncharacterized protein YdeI (YjbR/CyaY-like superfamily)